MRLDDSTIQLRSASALASMDLYEILPTPENYELWYEYHSGSNPGLRQTIDVLISNHRGFDESTLRDLYNGFLSTKKEQEAVRQASTQVLKTLQDVITFVDSGRTDARQFSSTLTDFASESLERRMDTLKESVEMLLLESKKMAGRSDYLGVRMRETSTKIQTLERNLETALRDATMDALTGVANRKSFEQTIRKLAGDAMNSGEELALLMVDIDHFKEVNDTWGHQIGDIVLRHVAKTLAEAVRGQDYIARYGGEEFSILLPRTDAHSAVSVAENIRHALARKPLELEITPPMKTITVSIGASCYEPGGPLTEWIGRSDTALYRAKKEGRNCVHFS